MISATIRCAQNALTSQDLYKACPYWTEATVERLPPVLIELDVLDGWRVTLDSDRDDAVAVLLGRLLLLTDIRVEPQAPPVGNDAFRAILDHARATK